MRVICEYKIKGTLNLFIYNSHIFYIFSMNLFFLEPE